RPAAENGAGEIQDASYQGEEDAALHTRVQAPGQAGCNLLAAAQPPGADRRRYHEADRHDQGDDREDSRPRPLELAEHQGRGPGPSWPVQPDRVGPSGWPRRFKEAAGNRSEAGRGPEADRGNDGGYG